MTEVAHGSIGPETTYDLQFVDGGALLVVGYEGADMGIDLKLKFSAKPLLKLAYPILDKIKALIPGTLDDMIIDELKEKIDSYLK